MLGLANIIKKKKNHKRIMDTWDNIRIKHISTTIGPVLVYLLRIVERESHGMIMGL